jgi:hypothetical protein
MSKRFSGGLALVAMLMLPTYSLAARNRLVNPSFEADFEGWTSFGNAYVETAYAQDGGKSLKLYGNWWYPWNSTGVYQNLDAIAGQVWTFSGYGFDPSADPVSDVNQNFALLKIVWFDGPNATGNALQPLPGPGAVFGDYPGIESGPINAASSLDVWLPVSAVGEAPPGTQSVQLLALFLQPNWEAGSLWFDNLSATVGGCWAHEPVFDINDDGHVDDQDLEFLNSCLTGPAIPLAETAPAECQCMDRNADDSVDQQDFGIFQRCYSGPSVNADPNCGI